MANCELCMDKLGIFNEFYDVNGVNVCFTCKTKCVEYAKFEGIETYGDYLKAKERFISEFFNKVNAKKIADGYDSEFNWSEEDISEYKKEEEAKKQEADRLAEEEAEKAKADLEKARLQAKKAREEEEKARNEMINDLKNRGFDGYYEYMTLSLLDESGGYIDTSTVTSNLNTLGQQGWRLVCAYSNELGHNTKSAGLLGFSVGSNATVDQNVLILERFVKI